MRFASFAGSAISPGWGWTLPFGFTALTYIAGFAFTVSPGKVGEMARARYYSRLGISLPDVAGAFFVERLMDVMAMLVLASSDCRRRRRAITSPCGAAGGIGCRGVAGPGPHCPGVAVASTLERASRLPKRGDPVGCRRRQGAGRGALVVESGRAAAWIPAGACCLGPGRAGSLCARLDASRRPPGRAPRVWESTRSRCWSGRSRSCPAVWAALRPS